MIPRGRGKTINTSSLQSEVGRPSIAPYTAAKGRGEDADQVHVQRMGEARNPSERHWAGLFQDRDEPRLVQQPDLRRLGAWPHACRTLGEVSELKGVAVFLASTLRAT